MPEPFDPIDIVVKVVYSEPATIKVFSDLQPTTVKVVPSPGGIGATGATGSSGVISVTSPITNTGTSTAANIGINQSLLTLTQSQITNLTTDLSGKANLTGGNSFTGTQIVSNSAIGSSPIIIDAITGTTANMLDFKLNGVSLTNFDSIGGLWVRSTAATFGAVGNFGVKASASTRVPMQVAAATGQSADLTRWYANDGTSVLALIASTGSIRSTGHIQAGTNTYVDGQMYSAPTNATTKGLVVRGAVSQTANLQEWQISDGTARAFINSSGDIQAPASVFTYSSRVNSGGSAVVPMIIKGTAAQSANLNEWQDSSGTILARINNGGAFVSSSVGVFGAQSNTPNAQLYVLNGNAANPGFVVRGAASQAGDYTTWQNSGGTTIAALTSGSSFYATGQIRAGASTSFAQLSSIAATATTIALGVRAAASQTASLQEWQNSDGSVASSVTSTGAFRINSAYGGTMLAVTAGGASTIGTIIRGAVSQTADLQQWQNSAGSVIAKIDSAGSFNTTQSATVSGVIGVGTNADATYQASILIGSTTRIGMRIRSQPSQTADMTQWQNNAGTVLSKISATGLVTLTTDSASENILNLIQGPSAAAVHIYSTGDGYIGWIGNRANGSRRFAFESNPSTDSASNFGLYHYDSAGANPRQMFSSSYSGYMSIPKWLSTAPTSSTTPTIIRGTTAQTANLTEWQDSTFATLASVSSTGILDAQYVRGNFTGSTRSGVRQTSPYSYLPTFTYQALGAQTGDLTVYANGAGTTIAGVNVNAQSYTGSTDPIPYYAGGATTATSGNGTTATITTTATHGLAIGDVVTVAGVTPTGYNGRYILTAVSTNTISYANTTTGSQTVAGTVAVPPQTSITARSAATPALVVKSAGYVADVQRWLNTSGGTVAGINPYGTFYTLASANYFRSDNPSNYIFRTLGAVNQREDAIQVTDTAGTVRGGFNAYGQLYTGPSAITGSTTAITAASASSTSVATFTYAGTVQRVTIGHKVTIAGFTTETYYNGSFVVTAVGGTSGAYTFTVIANSGTFTVGSATQFGTFVIPAQLSVTSTSAGTTGIVVRGATSQAASLLEAQDSSGTVLSRITPTGAVWTTVPLNGFGTGSAPSAWGGFSPVVEIRNSTSSFSGINFFMGGGPFVRAYDSSGNAKGSWNADGSFVMGPSNTKLGTLSVYSDASGTIASVIRGAVSQTADLQQWQNSAGSVLGKVDANGNFTMGANLTFTNPGIGTPTTFTFTKTNDNAWLKVTERASDATTYEFGMADNPDGSDYFQWRFDDWQNASTGWMPFQITAFLNRFIAKNNIMYGGFQLPYNSGFYTYNASVGGADQEVNRYYPSNSTSTQLSKDAGSGTGTITVDATIYNGVGATAYWVMIETGGTTFKWGTGSYSGTATATGVTITGSPQTLSSNLTVTLSLTGHVANDRWSFRAYPTPQVAIGGGALGSVTTSIFSKADFIGLAIRGASSQTSDLQQWQTSTGTVLTRVLAGGQLRLGSSILGSAFAVNNDVFGASVIGAVVRGATSQTANLQEWQFSDGTVLARIASSGQFAAPSIVGNNFQITSAGAFANGTSANPSGIQAYFLTLSASNIGLVVRGAASQTADFLQLQNSAGTILASINSNGAVTANGGYQTNSSIYFTSGNGRILSPSATTNIQVSVNRNTAFGIDTGSFGGGAGVLMVANATTVPTSNPTGGGILYVDSGLLKYRDPSGGITPLSFPSVATQTSWTGAVSLTQAESMGTYISKQLTGNTTVTVDAGITGQTYTCTLELQQDTTGSRTIILKGVRTAYGVTLVLTTTASAIDIVRLEWNGTYWTAFMGAAQVSVPAAWV